MEPKVKVSSAALKTILVVGVIVILAGCGAYVETDYSGYDGPVVLDGPDLYLFDGGYYGRGHDIRGYSRRGHESRAGHYSHAGGHGGRRH